MSIWSGEAPVPVVFLHGFATSTQMTWVEPGWFDLVKEGGRRPLGYDLLGHGKADTPNDIEAYKDLVTPVVEQLPFTPDEGRQIDIVGYSLGARTALDITLRHPQLVRRLVLGGIGRNVIDAPATPPGLSGPRSSRRSAKRSHSATTVTSPLTNWRRSRSRPFS